MTLGGAILRIMAGLVLVGVLCLARFMVQVSRQLAREAAGPQPGNPREATVYYLLRPEGIMGSTRLDAFLAIEARYKSEYGGYRAIAVHPNGYVGFLGLEGMKVTHMTISQGAGEARRSWHSFHLTGLSGEFGAVFSGESKAAAIRNMIVASFGLETISDLPAWIKTHGHLQHLAA